VGRKDKTLIFEKIKRKTEESPKANLQWRKRLRIDRGSMLAMP